MRKAPQILLIDADSTVRGTVASVCRDMNVARVSLATSVALGEQWLKTGRLSGLVLSMGEQTAALALLGKLREGGFPCGADVPVVVMAHECTADLAKQLKALKVRRLLLQPFKLRDVIQTLEQLLADVVGQAAVAGGAGVPKAATESASIGSDRPEAPEAEEPAAGAEAPSEVEAEAPEETADDPVVPPDPAAEPAEVDAST